MPHQFSSLYTVEIDSQDPRDNRARIAKLESDYQQVLNVLNGSYEPESPPPSTHSIKLLQPYDDSPPYVRPRKVTVRQPFEDLASPLHFVTHLRRFLLRTQHLQL